LFFIQSRVIISSFQYKCTQNFGRKSWRKRPLGRPWRRWEDIIKMDLKEISCDVEIWIHVSQDRDQWGGAVVNMVMNLRVP
jgi:hypothetical protein